MARNYTESIVNDEIVGLLNELIDKSVDSTHYANVMFELGLRFGDLLVKGLNSSDTKISLACTVEDADYLGRGILEVLEKYGKEVFLAVFWNKRFKPGMENNVSIAPILREFHEEGYTNSSILVIIKSIISSSCVVRTNLTHLIEKSDPRRIFVVAPVLLKGATQSLESEFDSSIAKKFEYLYFAEDTDKSSDGWVNPGIGGDVYQRLGFENQSDKNRYTPGIVLERRHKHEHPH